MTSLSKDEIDSPIFSEINLLLQNPLKVAKKELQRRKFQFISELASLLISNNQNREIYKIISRLILVSLESQEMVFLEKIFTNTNNNPFSRKQSNEFLGFLKKIHTFLFHCSNLTEKEKVEFYRLERFFIKQYFEQLSLLD